MPALLTNYLWINTLMFAFGRRGPSRESIGLMAGLSGQQVPSDWHSSTGNVSQAKDFRADWRQCASGGISHSVIYKATGCSFLIFPRRCPFILWPFPFSLSTSNSEFALFISIPFLLHHCFLSRHNFLSEFHWQPVVCNFVVKASLFCRQP